MKIYDSLIVGGGYAGLSAGIYLTRFKRSALILDKANGRWKTHEHNDNYLGFPKGIKAVDLRNRGLEQAKRFGAKYVLDEAINIKKSKGLFIIQGTKKTYFSKTVIIATGVVDLFPKFKNWQDYVGISLFWCITCDGYKTINKKVIIVGNDNEAAETCTQFLNFTNQLSFVTNTNQKLALSERWIRIFKKYKIPIYEGKISKVYGKQGKLTKVELNNAIQIDLDFMFNQQGAVTNSKLAKILKVKTDEMGYIITDINQKTNIPFVYAAGDITKPYAHQIASAVHEGSMAGQSANYDLYLPHQKNIEHASKHLLTVSKTRPKK